MNQEPSLRSDLEEIAALFRTKGKYCLGAIVPQGHINETYCLTFNAGGAAVRYILQKVNTNVFRTPDKLMDNIVRVTSHARAKIKAAGGDPDREVLNLVPTIHNAWFARTPDGGFWRMYDFIEGARTYERPDSPERIYSASRAFGRFQRRLADLPGGRLHETIPGFHDTRLRFKAFLKAVDQDLQNRAAAVKPEIDFVLRHEGEIGLVLDGLASGDIPERITHNDTKLNNVMFDLVTGQGICVIDLDTVMPGSALYDFGDSVRLGAATAAEDERALEKVGFDPALFDRLAAGYLDSAGGFLVKAEMELLAFSARLLTFECGLRFLTDHLEGDTYFRIHRPGHNLDRCRTQFKMVGAMEGCEDRMAAAVRLYAGG